MIGKNDSRSKKSKYNLINRVLLSTTLSEKIAHPTVYHHLGQLSVDIQLNGLIKCREDSGVQMKLTQVIFHSLSWIHLSQVH